MAFVLTENASIACMHQGAIKPSASQGKLKVDGSKVLLAGDIAGTKFSTCTLVTDTSHGIQKCTSATTEAGISSSKLKVDGKSVLLQGSNGPVDGFPPIPSTWTASSAGQTKLKAS